MVWPVVLEVAPCERDTGMGMLVDRLDQTFLEGATGRFGVRETLIVSCSIAYSKYIDVPFRMACVLGGNAQGGCLRLDKLKAFLRYGCQQSACVWW